MVMKMLTITTLMFLNFCGGFLFLNFEPRSALAVNRNNLEADFGWPLPCMHRSDWRTAVTFEGTIREQWNRENIVMNLISAVFLLVGSACVCEMWVRWRGARGRGDGLK